METHLVRKNKIVGIAVVACDRVDLRRSLDVDEGLQTGDVWDLTAARRSGGVREVLMRREEVGIRSVDPSEAVAETRPSSRAGAMGGKEKRQLKMKEKRGGKKETHLPQLPTMPNLMTGQPKNTPKQTRTMIRRNIVSLAALHPTLFHLLRSITASNSGSASCKKSSGSAFPFSHKKW